LIKYSRTPVSKKEYPLTATFILLEICGIPLSPLIYPFPPLMNRQKQIYEMQFQQKKL
jgi:hypothetical protein